MFGHVLRMLDDTPAQLALSPLRFLRYTDTGAKMADTQQSYLTKCGRQRNLVRLREMAGEGLTLMCTHATHLVGTVRQSINTKECRFEYNIMTSLLVFIVSSTKDRCSSVIHVWTDNML